MLWREVASMIVPRDREVERMAWERQDNLTKPPRSLGRLEELSVLLASMQGTLRPRTGRKAVFVMAGDHGVAEEGVSKYPQEVTAQMVLNFLRGGAAINAISRSVGARVIVVDIGVKADLPEHTGLVSKKVRKGTGNIAKGPAMTREEAERALDIGVELALSEVDKGLDIVATGDMGIANTTPSAAVICALTGARPEDVVGRGTGIDDTTLARKIEVVRRALDVNRPNPSDPLDVLHKVGGLEIAGLAGIVLGCASRRVPVVLAGFISTAAGLVACAIEPRAGDYLFAGHLSAEKGHRIALDKLGLEPILNLGMRLGEGTGAVLAMAVLDAAASVLNEMATFEEAGVSGPAR